MKIRNLALTLSLVMAGSAFAADKDVVKYRENNMEIIGGHMGSIVAIVKGEVPYTDDLLFHAEGLAAAAPMIVPAFKTEAMTDKSEALPDIWKDWNKFEQAALKLEETSGALAAAAKTGNMAAVGAALGDVGKSCKGCHDNFTKED
jgi:Cytochrome c556